MKLFHPSLPLGIEGPLVGKLVIWSYVVLLALLCCYGMHRYLMVFLYYRYKNRAPKPKEQWKQLPHVTVQLPIFNEAYVVERLIDATCAIDYPREKLEIQVLDDSTDDTVEISRRKVEEWKAKGVDIVFIHRADRTGYKAGALDYGMQMMKGRFVLVSRRDGVIAAMSLQRERGVQYSRREARRARAIRLRAPPVAPLGAPLSQ